MELDQFIKENRRQALSVIRKSKYLNLLDHMDEEEIIHCALWNVWLKFNPQRACLSRFIYIVVNSYMIKMIKKKIRVRKHECGFDGRDYPYSPKDEVSELFTESEWNCLTPLLEGNQHYAADKVNLSFSEYRGLLRVIGKVTKNRFS